MTFWCVYPDTLLVKIVSFLLLGLLQHSYFISNAIMYDFKLIEHRMYESFPETRGSLLIALWLFFN